MQIPANHLWTVTYSEAVILQETLRDRIILQDPSPVTAPTTIAGADISYARGSNRFFAAVVLLSYPAMETLEVATAIDTVTFPYIPGLLSFREGPVLVRACERLSHVPDIMVFDGQGIAHPRGLGLASHMGIILDIPTIGCAKSLLVGHHDTIEEQAGAWTPLIYQERLVGAALRTKRKVKPVFVSQGHKISLEHALNIIQVCCRGYRLPEPTRQAHLAVNSLRERTDKIQTDLKDNPLTLA